MSDDFFSHELSSPPKQAASLTSSTNIARQRKGPPPPPPRRPVGTTATTTTTTVSAPVQASPPVGTTTRPRPTPSRPALNATAPTNSTTTGKMATTTTAAAAATTTTTTPTMATPTARPRQNPRSTAVKAAPPAARPLPTARSARSAPVMSRPVGQYYAATTNTAAPPPNPVEDTSAADTWDWGTPAPAPVAVAGAWAPPNPQSWTAPTTDNSSASSSDWYGTDNQTNSNGMYTSSGFYGTSTSQMTETAHDPFLSGSMEDSPAAPTSAIFQPKPFIPQASPLQGDSTFMMGEEAPLLEELGINLQHIGMKTKAVILPFGRFGGTSMDPADIVKDADLAGPIAFCLVLGAEMVLTGKLQFGYIYGFGVFGCASMTLIVNLMSPLAEGISIWTVSSVLGYALIPVNVLAAVKLVVINLVNLQALGRFLGLLTVAWSTIASTRLLELGFGLREQRYLIAYPVALLYSAFVMITIF